MTTVLLKDQFKEALKGQWFSKKPKTTPPGRILKDGYIGIKRVRKVHSSSCKQGFLYQYSWYENGKQRKITSIDLQKLKDKAHEGGLEWVIEDAECFEKLGIDLI